MRTPCFTNCSKAAGAKLVLSAKILQHTKPTKTHTHILPPNSTFKGLIGNLIFKRCQRHVAPTKLTPSAWGKTGRVRGGRTKSSEKDK